MKTDRKAMMMSVGLALATTVVLVRVFSLFSGVSDEVFNSNPLGRNQLWFIEAVQQNQKALLFEDQYWGFAARQAVIEVLGKGGHYTAPDCGQFQGYSIWQTNDTSCYPSLSDIGNSGKQALSIYETKRKALKNSPNANYEFFMGRRGAETIVTGAAIRQIATDISCAGGRGSPMLGLYPEFFDDSAFLSGKMPDSCGRIYEKPSFKEEIDVDLGIFEKAASQVPAIISKIKSCESGGKSLLDCRKEAVGSMSGGEVKWLDSCETGPASIFSSFAEQYQECIGNWGVNCTCVIDLPSRADVEDGYYTIKITGEGLHTIAEMEGYPLLKHSFNAVGPWLAETTEAAPEDEINYVMQYSEGELDDVFLRTDYVEWRPRSPDGKQWLYKDSRINVAFIDINNYDAFKSMKACGQLKKTDERHVKLCADTGKKILAYDEANQELKMQPAVLKLAVYIPET